MKCPECGKTVDPAEIELDADSIVGGDGCYREAFSAGLPCGCRLHGDDYMEAFAAWGNAQEVMNDAD